MKSYMHYFVALSMFAFGGCSSDSDLPQSQAELLKISEEYAEMYKTAGDKGATRMQKELTEKKTVEDRSQALQKYDSFENWKVKVKNVKMSNYYDNNKEVNFAELEVIFGFKYARFAGVQLSNSNRNFIGVSKNAIVEDTPLFSVLLGLKKDQQIIVSGQFWKNEKGTIFEKSLSESGGMIAPEYVVTFTDIKLN